VIPPLKLLAAANTTVPGPRTTGPSPSMVPSMVSVRPAVAARTICWPASMATAWALLMERFSIVTAPASMENTGNAPSIVPPAPLIVSLSPLARLIGSSVADSGKLPASLIV